MGAEERSVRGRHCRSQQTETTESQHVYIHLSISPCMGCLEVPLFPVLAAGSAMPSTDTCTLPCLRSLPTGSQTWPFSGVTAQEIQTHKQAGEYRGTCGSAWNKSGARSLSIRAAALTVQCIARLRTEGCRYKLLFWAPGCAVLKNSCTIR